MDLARYAELFATESREHLSAINHLLLGLERSSQNGIADAEAVGAIFRAVHTIKGMSATMGYTAVADLAHALEAALDRVRRGDVALSAPLLDACFAAADALERAIDLSVQGRDGDIAVDDVTARLRALLQPLPAPPASDDHHAAPSSSGGTRLRVRIAADSIMPGVRAVMVLQRASTLGTVRLLDPASEVALQADGFARELTLSVETGATRDVIETTIRAAGDIANLEFLEGAPERRTVAGRGALEVSRTMMSTRADPGSANDAGQAKPARNVRIDLRRLDTLMNLIGELVITRGRLAELARTRDDPSLADTVDQASRLVAELQDEIMLTRMVPVWQVFDRFPRLVRDAARTLGKEVELTVEGKEIELDRSMLDEIGDPIVHLLRNAVDHGIESPDVRRSAGKPVRARLTLSATRERSSIVVRVQDDGRGVDRPLVLEKARAMGLVETAKTELSDDELLRVLARPGLSTAERVSDISGRGVGLDAVVSRVRGLGGSVELKTAPRVGTTVTLRLPVTLAIVRALVARVADEMYAVPITHVTETVAVGPAALRTIRGDEVLVLRDDVLPLIRFRERVGLPDVSRAAGQVVVLEVGQRRAAVVVDELTGQQDIVVKQFDAVRGGPAIFSGATILSDGSPALIVDVGSLV